MAVAILVILILVVVGYLATSIITDEFNPIKWFSKESDDSDDSDDDDDGDGSDIVDYGNFFTGGASDSSSSDSSSSGTSNNQSGDNAVYGYKKFLSIFYDTGVRDKDPVQRMDLLPDPDIPNITKSIKRTDYEDKKNPTKKFLEACADECESNVLCTGFVVEKNKECFFMSNVHNYNDTGKGIIENSDYDTYLKRTDRENKCVDYIESVTGADYTPLLLNFKNSVIDNYKNFCDHLLYRRLIIEWLQYFYLKMISVF